MENSTSPFFWKVFIMGMLPLGTADDSTEYSTDI